MSDLRIKTVVASAGAGKTTRIVSAIAEEVKSREPEEIVATTFTVKAADELIERSRANLFKTGQAVKASRLLGARFGTVNSICGQIVSEHTMDLGRSPRAEIIPEEGIRRIFEVAASSAIENYAPTLNELAELFGYFEPKRQQDAERSDWRTTVRRLIELARSNGLNADGLKRSAELSKKSFLPLLPTIQGDGKHLDGALANAVRQAVATIPASPSTTATGSVKLLRQANAAFSHDEPISWPDWARLSKVKCAKTKDGAAFDNALATVVAAAARHPEHPRLRQHCEQFIDTLFACAAEALTAYQDYKAQRGLMDFVDQEALTLQVLHDDKMAETLSERISRVFVDEFQDSSPLQIAIFTAMAGLVDQSTWVGDPKQAIYGFRNADCVLTQAAFDGVAKLSKAPQDVLSTSYRSRDGIIRLVNATFEPAFSAMGLEAADHSFSGTARREEGFKHSPFAVWWLDGKVEEQFAALAAGIRDALAQTEDWKVFDKSAEQVRAVEAGDIAVLCRSNADVTRIASSLSSLGVKVAVERDGLIRTPHVELVLAAFRWVADPTDRLALAELARFFSDDPTSDGWLQAAGADDRDALEGAVPISSELAAMRNRVIALTPAELLDAIILLPEVTRRVEGWGNPDTRLEDLEALRGFARSFEQLCKGAGTPATPSGLILALDRDDPQRPKSLQSGAVKVMTYHGAKGLEWPLVVLTGLNREPKARLFEPVAEVDGELDWRNPLSNRWIRYWPWPYASQSKDVSLDETALTSTIGQLAAKRAREEETRLLYVGLTRARDYVVFAPPSRGDLNWLGVLDVDGTNHLHLPNGGENEIVVGTERFGARVNPMAIDDTLSYAPARPAHVRVSRTVIKRAPLHRRPSSENGTKIFSILENISLGPRLPITGSPDMAKLGEAVHAVFAADDRTMEPGERLRRAEGILGRWQVSEVRSSDVLGACDRLNAHLQIKMPNVRLYREAPIFARIGDQLVSGRIDLLGEDDDGYVVLDHKSFPGSRDKWSEKALSYGGQLALYAEAIATATGRPCDRLYIHMPIVGVLMQVG
ncbi:UvrD-helicase domain-containing protein [Asticcacaulis solisilvae]|uniref:UvrD-helicase domain-containing protein n=1 Tax=Asticcacaulis solisilvae TaxID=1217274 RepID=UPI003FD6C749